MKIVRNILFYHVTGTYDNDGWQSSIVGKCGLKVIQKTCFRVEREYCCHLGVQNDENQVFES